MMSSADDQLCLNISSSFPSASSGRRKPLSAQQRWQRKKQRAQERKCSSAPEETKRPFKRTRLQEADTEAPPPQVLQAPPPEPTAGGGQRQKKKKKKEEEEEEEEKEEEEGGMTEAGRSSIKTSSLFKHNPDIPEILSSAVSPLKEVVFTSTSFCELDLHPHLVATLNKDLNVSTLTSVQRQTIPVLLSGRDAVVRSQTGSGKTLSYAVPLVQSLQRVRPKLSRADGPLAVVIVPTRELAQQTLQVFQKLLKPFTWIVPGVLMGGEKRKSEKARLRKGINILVSTPGRLVDHIQHTLSIVLSSVRWLVLDEADRTLDLGFEKEVTVILNGLNSTGPSRQNVLLSATLTQGVTHLADVCLNDPVSIHVSGPASSGPACSDPSPASQSQSFAVPEALKQFVVLVPSKLRLVCLAAFILDKCQFSQRNKLIVFASSCEVVDFLHRVFSAVLSGPSATISFLRLHGNLKQEERTDVFQQFSASQSGVLLCTDVAARGLHLPQVTWIVQFTPPSAATEYVHRVGRTARIGGRGSSLLFLAPAETAFISELTNHGISLSQVKLMDVLSSLMKEDAYKGRGKYHSKTSSRALQQEIRERATVLQTHFENFVHADAASLQSAKTAFQSFLRAYTTYPTHLKHIFHIRSLHLGHAAKSFGLRDAPQGLSSGAPPPRTSRHNNKKTSSKGAGRAERRCGLGQRDVRLLHSEFSSGLDERDAKTKKKKKKSTAPGQSEGEELLR